MNRLVLIGNGFDCAHGLKTRYEDFVYWYFEQRRNSFVNCRTNISDDHLCKMISNNHETWHMALTYDTDLKYLEGKDLFNYITRHHDLYKLESKYLIEKILKSIETKGWVDIENDYYSLLTIRIMSIKPHKEIETDYLNLQLDLLRTNLISYLGQEEKKESSYIEAIMDKIYRPIKKREIAVANNTFANGRIPEENAPSTIMLLNFNYTKTPELYLKDQSNVSINYIHGKLDKPQSVIFGYGDELDSDFERLKNLNDNECLRHMKSIRYLESDNYRKILEFIESGPFQICIMGHSCGNSDRTLLNTLFEHRNCASIKPYFYINEKGENNYMNLVQNISRNFTDMKLMRDRVVNKEYCEPLTK